jgi:hypothetical protein
MTNKIEWLDRTALRLPYLTLCLNEKQYKAAVKHIKIENPSYWLSEDNGACVHTFENGSKIACVVCLRVDEGDSSITIAGRLVHEAVHVWQQNMESIGETRAGTEIEAYGIQNIAEVLFDSYRKQTSKQLYH